MIVVCTPSRGPRFDRISREPRRVDRARIRAARRRPSTWRRRARVAARRRAWPPRLNVIFWSENTRGFAYVFAPRSQPHVSSDPVREKERRKKKPHAGTENVVIFSKSNYWRRVRTRGERPRRFVVSPPALIHHCLRTPRPNAAHNSVELIHSDVNK